MWLLHIKHSLPKSVWWCCHGDEHLFASWVTPDLLSRMHHEALVCISCVKHWCFILMSHESTVNQNHHALPLIPPSLFFIDQHRSNHAVFTLWLSGVSPAALEVCVATPLLNGLHLAPEGIQAQFVGVLLLVLGGWRVGAVWVLLSGCLVLRAGPGLHAHLGGAGISGTDIHARKEIARMHANRRAETRRRIQTHRRNEDWSDAGRMNQPGEPRAMERTKGAARGARWRERGGLYCSC